MHSLLDGGSNWVYVLDGLLQIPFWHQYLFFQSGAIQQLRWQGDLQHKVKHSAWWILGQEKNSPLCRKPGVSWGWGHTEGFLGWSRWVIQVIQVKLIQWHPSHCQQCRVIFSSSGKFFSVAGIKMTFIHHSAKHLWVYFLKRGVYIWNLCSIFEYIVHFGQLVNMLKIPTYTPHSSQPQCLPWPPGSLSSCLQLPIRPAPLSWSPYSSVRCQPPTHSRFLNLCIFYLETITFFSRLESSMLSSKIRQMKMEVRLFIHKGGV